MERRKWLYLVCFMLVFAFLLSGCGREEERQMGIDGYVYVPGEPLPLTASTKLVARGEYLYYLMGAHTLGRLSLEEGVSDAGFSPIRPGSSCSILSFAVDEDMAVYYILAEGKYSGSGLDATVESTNVFLVKKLPDGSQAYKVALKELNGGTKDMEESYLEVNSEKQVFALVGMSIYGVDAEGDLLGEISLEDYGMATSRYAKLLEGERGKVYFYNIGQTFIVYEVVTEGRYIKLASVSGMERPFQANCDLYGSPYGLLCDVSMNHMLYQYQMEDGSWNELLCWYDSDVMGSIVSMAQTAEDKLAVASGDGDVRIFTKTAVSELPEKKVLVLANIGYLTSADLGPFITEFNRNNPEYRIVVETYGWTQDELTRLDIRLMSSNPPDLLRMDEMDVAKYAGKQVLEDLSPYLETSSLVHREDYLESILEGYTISGRLVAIPDEFCLRTLIGRTQEAGELEGWTAEDIMVLAEKYPQYRLMRMVSLEFVYPFFADYVFERYIDWESGSCDFDSESFREFMKWMGRHTEGIEIDYDRRYSADEVLFYDDIIMNGEISYQANYLFGCEAMIMGYPSEDGRIWFPTESMDTLAIVSKSPYKEEAWKFIEAYLSREGEVGGREPIYFHFPTRTDLLEKHLKEDLADGSKKGEIYVNGEPVKWNGATKEEIEQIRGYIEAADFTPKGSIRDAVSEIVMEELAVYLNGEKPVEEVSRIIQNRVINLVQENM